MGTNIETIMEIAKKELTDCPAHNFEHVMRVYNMALRLSKDENVDMEVIKIAALLHDIGGMREMSDPTGNTDHAVEGAKMAKIILEDLGYSKGAISHVCDCIVSHRYRTNNKPKTLEAKIVFDADKLETVGVIGVARSFCWVGKNNAHIYRKIDVGAYADENLGGRRNGRIQNKTQHSPQLMWETKDKHILEYLQTEKAKGIAKDRLAFSKMFLERLEQEIEGIF